jgi:glycosyltransferase involved in cell wall biosynthesis
MRVLHVAPSIDPATGGPAVALAGLTRALAKEGADVSVVTAYRDGEDLSAADELRRSGVRVTSIGPTFGAVRWRPTTSGTLAPLVEASDVVHVHAVWEDVQYHAIRLARRFGVPFLIRPCGMLDPWSLAQHTIRKKLYLSVRLRKMLAHAAAVHFTSDTEARLARPVVEGRPEIVEPNGIDLAEFDPPPPRGAFRVRYPRLGDRPFVLFLSRVHPKKGLDLLVPAFAKAAPADVSLVLAGPVAPGYKRAVNALANAHGIADRVVWTGMLHGDERLEAYFDAVLFVLPSYQENFGIVVVEALAAGCPVVISDQVNIWREVVDAGVGAAVPTKIDDLADAIRLWMSNPEKRLAAGERGRAFVRERYDWNTIARRWVGHYERIVARGSRTSPSPTPVASGP